MQTPCCCWCAPGAKTAIQADAIASLVHLLKGGRPEPQLRAASSLNLLAQHLSTARGGNLVTHVRWGHRGLDQLG